MRGFSKAIITGNITRDPELRTTPNGASVCSFSVAVNRVYRDSNGEQKEDVSFIDCSAWGKLGEMINQYAKKGSGVLVSGRLDQRSWEDKTSGQKRSRVEIVVEDFNFTGAARDNGGSNVPSMNESPADIPDDIPDEEIDLSDVPF
ncbi:single-stranded DNA-binding protein [Candidatus Saccharibacteria bacterium]|nr:single-stranded DNA-binding protein [Candidatus Saccharibacteria bacterium]MDO5475061.1 single-stranded DNA-binding protein [Candidatus Saccharibacteria bacterium]